VSEALSPRHALLDLIATLSFTPGDFTLASGQKSDYYIDCRITTLHAEGGRLAGIVLLDLIREHFPTARAVGGLTMGADPLVSNTASASAWEAADYAEFLELDPEEDHGPEPGLVHGFLVRKAEKTHGTGRRLEGFLKAGADVVIVDDVCTTGGSTITAIEAPCGSRAGRPRDDRTRAGGGTSPGGCRDAALSSRVHCDSGSEGSSSTGHREVTF
jgi:orotate phosphoribosyltransferase